MLTQTRVNISAAQPEIWKIIKSVDDSLTQSGLDKKLWELIKIRASQINRCVFCLDLHTKDAIKIGEYPRRIFALNAWQESPLFSNAEKSVLRMVEEMTEVSKTGISEECYNDLKTHLDEDTIALILIAISQINFLNRIAISTAIIPKI